MPNKKKKNVSKEKQPMNPQQLTQAVEDVKVNTQHGDSENQASKVAKKATKLKQLQSTDHAKHLTQAANSGEQLTKQTRDDKQSKQHSKTAEKSTQHSKDAGKLIQLTKNADQLYSPRGEVKTLADGKKTAKDLAHSKRDAYQVCEEIINEESCYFSAEKCLKKAYFCAVLQDKGTITLKAVFNTFYCHEDTKADGGEASFDKWLSNLEISNKQLKNKFGKSEFLKKDKNSPIDKNFDLTTYYRLITLIGEKYYLNMFCIDCKEKIEKIYHYKNLICHFGPLSEENCNVENLITLFRELLRCTAEHFKTRKYIDQALSELSKPINVQENSHKLQEEYQNHLFNLIGHNPYLFFMREGQRELKRKKISPSFAIPFYWICKVSDEKSFLHQSSKLFEPISMNVFTNPYMLCYEKKLCSEDLLKPDPDSASPPPQVIFVVGHGGCGKTTLCQQIFLEWQNKSEANVSYQALKSMDLVFLIEMRSTHCKTLDKFLSEFMEETASVKKKFDVKSYLAEMNVLYIIDGFDEKNDDNIKLVRDIAKLPSRTNRVLLTTRPEFVRDAREIFIQIPEALITVVKMIGFDREGRDQFSCRILSQNHVKSAYPLVNPEEFCRFLKEQEEVLNEYLNFPLTIALILLLWLETSNMRSICTATHLYKQLFEMLTSKLIMARKYSSVRDCSINNRSVKAVLDVLSKCSKCAVFSDDFKIELSSSSMKELDECCEEYDVRLTEFLSAFVQFVGHPDSKKLHANYSFFHRTEMEFLAADYLARTCMTPEALNVSYTEMQKYYGVLPFLVGHLGATNKLDKYAPDIIQLLQCMQVSSENFNFFSKLVIESTTSNNHGDQCRKPFCSQLCDVMSHQKWHLDAETVLSGLRLLRHCVHLDLEGLVIDLSMSCDPDTDEYLCYLKSNLNKLKWVFERCNRHQKLELCFHIQKHYEKKGISDEYLFLVLGWSKLVKFTGAIGMEGVEHLSKFVYLKHLHLRMSESNVFNAFVEKCLIRCEKLKHLELVMDFPTDVEPSSLAPLDCKQSRVQISVRLRFDNIDRKNLPWALRVVGAVLHKDSMGGFDRITFHSTNFCRKKDVDVITKALEDKVFSKVIVTSHTRTMGNLNIIRKPNCPFVFEWDDR